MRIGAHELPGRVFLAPMAGITDLPFRTLCRRAGAALAVSEMISAQPALWASAKSRLRRAHAGEPRPVSVQIVGTEPRQMAEAARAHAAEGADLIDINMGCPAKKVCNRYAGSALLADEALVARILEAVVAAAGVPVTLKMRTGPDPARRNAVRIARIAESAGVTLLAIHGRTRACGFSGRAEYDTIAEVKAAVRIPVVANGDLASADDAHRVLARTGADAVMVGRAALGRPWLFAELDARLSGRPAPAAPGPEQVLATVREHLQGLYALYGEARGVRIARKHIAWYARGLPAGDALVRACYAAADAARQLAALERHFAPLLQRAA